MAARAAPNGRYDRAISRDWQRRIAGNCLSGLWPVPYPTAERAPEILGAQAEWRTWLLRGAPARCLLRGWRPPRSGGGAAAVTLALGLVPGP